MLRLACFENNYTTTPIFKQGGGRTAVRPYKTHDLQSIGGPA